MPKNCSTCGGLAWEALTFAGGSGRQKGCSLRAGWNGEEGVGKRWRMIHRVWLDVAPHTGRELREQGDAAGGCSVCIPMWLSSVGYRFPLHSCVCRQMWNLRYAQIVSWYVSHDGTHPHCQDKSSAELTRTVLKYLSRVSWHYVSQS